MKMAELFPLKMWPFTLIITKLTLPAAYEVCRGGIKHTCDKLQRGIREVFSFISWRFLKNV